MTCLVDLHRYWNGANDEFSDRGTHDKILFLDDHLPWLADRTRIADLGCGVGHLVEHFRKEGKYAEGITYQPREVEAAAKRGVAIVEGDLHQLPWPDEHFDAVVCWDAFEHCIAPLIALKEAHRVLQPRGKALYFIPGQIWQNTEYHLIVPTVTQMAHLARLVGFGGEVIDYSKHPQHAQDQMAVYRLVKL